MLLNGLGAGLDSIELVIPVVFVRADPVVHGAEGVRVERVHAPAADAGDADKPDAAENGEVLGDLGLGPAETADEGGDVGVRRVGVGEGREELAPARLGDGGEGVDGRGRAGHGGIYTDIGICQRAGVARGRLRCAGSGAPTFA